MRYFVKKQKPRMFDVEDWDDFSIPMVNNVTVYDDEEYTFTGILDHEGNEIHRTERIRAGFLSEILE
jgi:hypothetical protein